MPRPTKALECPSPPSCAPGAVLVETPRLVLRRFKPDDAPALARAANHRAVWDGVRDSFPHPYTLADAQAFVAVCVKGEKEKEEEEEEKEGGREPAGEQLVGCLGADPGQDVLYRTWELGYWLTPDAWGRGYATEAVGALLRWLLRTWPGVHRVQAMTLAANPRSAKVLLRCGFVLEGVQREAAEKGGVLQDLQVYAVLRHNVHLTEGNTRLTDSSCPKPSLD
ncbi:hypothetical protein V2A60_003119 [Cordyceps javanica]|uniref:Acetyltransferase (GNAT)domain-containing protein n=1 Tax=Cordyceps javanica TaxID=43265 RepID=A0A545W1B5_9HYPO|nr:acetyltransferase (GNAT)domain-containing protein [Cordyceps javanica]TQW07771.1 acetyltransferase (GNAT) domain-containing protein [Cordyceps javanica]